MSLILNLLYAIQSLPHIIYIIWKISVFVVVCFAWYRILQESLKCVFNGMENGFMNLFHGKRLVRVEKYSESIGSLEARIEKLVALNEQLEKEKEMLEQSKKEYETENQHFETMKESINMLKEEIQNLSSVVKNKTDEIIAKNRQVHELKDENDNLQSQLMNVSSDLEKMKKDDTLRQQYETTKCSLDQVNGKLEALKVDYETLKRESNERKDRYICEQKKLQSELENAKQINRELSVQYQISQNELKNANENSVDLKAHYETLCTQLTRSNEIIDDLNMKLNQAKADLENSNSKVDLMNGSLTETQESVNALKLSLNDEIHHSKVYRDQNEKLVQKINAMENNKRTWEKEISSLRVALKRYRENEEVEMVKHTELVHEMTRKVDEFKQEKVRLNYELREMTRKLEDLLKEKEQLVARFEEQQSKVLTQNDRALQEIQNEMRDKLDSANEKIVQKDEKLEQIEDLYKVQILEQLKSQLEKRVDELEASNMELETKLSSYNQRFSDHEVTSGEEYPLCTPPASPSRRGSGLALSPQTHKLLSSLSSTKYLSLARDSASPDLGIDSDHGRVSNSETTDHPAAGLDRSNVNKLIEENSQLQRMLLKTRQALENTIKQLAAANRRKCQIERDICKQLHKTQHIIRKARVNIQTSENGENDENVDPLANQA